MSKIYFLLDKEQRQHLAAFMGQNMLLEVGLILCLDFFKILLKNIFRYPASGGSEDWAKESANIKYVYLLELRPDEKSIF